MLLRRTLLTLAVLTSAAAAVVAWFAVYLFAVYLFAEGFVDRGDPQSVSWLGYLLPYLVVVVAAWVVMPGVNEVPEGFPTIVLWRFRTASVAIQGALWGTIGLTFGPMIERYERQARARRSGTTEAAPARPGSGTASRTASRAPVTFACAGLPIHSPALQQQAAPPPRDSRS